jgi:hypothetical protein
LYVIFFFFFSLAVPYSEVDMFGSQSQKDTDGSGELSETVTNYGDFVKGSDVGRYDFQRIIGDEKESLLSGCFCVCVCVCVCVRMCTLTWRAKERVEQEQTLYMYMTAYI